jgi:hypothetical protein
LEGGLRALRRVMLVFCWLLHRKLPTNRLGGEKGAGTRPSAVKKPSRPSHPTEHEGKRARERQRACERRTQHVDAG